MSRRANLPRLTSVQPEGLWPSGWQGARHGGRTLRPRRGLCLRISGHKTTHQMPNSTFFVNKKYTCSIINHWGPGVVGYSIQPPHNMKDRSGSHSVMTLGRPFGKSLPALSTLINDNGVCWQLQVWIMKGRSGVQNSAALRGQHLLPEQDSRPLGTEEDLTDRNFPRPSPLLP